MEKSGSQKALMVISVIDIIFGVLTLILGIVAIIGGGMMNVATPDMLAETGIDAADQGLLAAGLSIVAVMSIVSGIISLVEGILGVRASNDNQKIMPVWVLSLIGLALGVVRIISSIVQGTISENILSLIISLAIAAYMFWIANTIKTEAGK